MRAFGDADILKALLTYLLNTKTERVSQVVFKTIFSFLTNKVDFMKNQIFDVFSKALKDYADTDVPDEIISSFEKFKTAGLLSLLRSHNINDSEVIKELLRRLSVMFGNITVVIDEANLAFTEDVDHDLTRLKKAKRDLEALTLLSKELKEVFHLLIVY